MKKRQILEKIAELDDVASVAAAGRIYDLMTSVIYDGLTTDGVVHLGNKLGTFKTVLAPARVCRNPQTGADIQVPAKTKVKFKVSRALKTL